MNHISNKVLSDTQEKKTSYKVLIKQLLKYMEMKNENANYSYNIVIAGFV